MPYFVREVVGEVQKAFAEVGIDLGMPMNVRYPDEKEFMERKVEVHFEGGDHFTLWVDRGRNSFGEFAHIKRVKVALGDRVYDRREAEGLPPSPAKRLMARIEKWAGPVKWEYSEGEFLSFKLRFTLEGDSWRAFSSVRAWRQNELPLLEWNDLAHPRHGWAKRREEKEK